MSDEPTRKPRGFAAITPEQRREIASKGGKAAHEQGKAHKFNSETGRAAGLTGGKVRGKNGSGHRASKYA